MYKCKTWHYFKCLRNCNSSHVNVCMFAIKDFNNKHIYLGIKIKILCVYQAIFKEVTFGAGYSRCVEESSVVICAVLLIYRAVDSWTHFLCPFSILFLCCIMIVANIKSLLI